MREKKRDRKEKKQYLDDDIRILVDDDLDSRLERLPDDTRREEGRDKDRNKKKLKSPVKQKKSVSSKKETIQREAPKKETRKGKKPRNKEFARITYLFVSIFLVLMGYIVYFNVVQAKSIINSPYNRRQDIFADRVVRGKILDKDGEVLAETDVDEEGNETRRYPKEDLFAHVLGYSVKGKAGLESVENFHLLTSNAFIPEKIVNEFQGEKNIGDNVITTLDSNLQQAAYDALGKNKGAVVVMEASTGKILSMVSKPTYDPNHVAENWASLNTDEDSALLNRATQGKYAPGSTFKLVTALAFMRQNSNYDSYTYDCSSEIEHAGTTIHCSGDVAHGQEDLRSSVANSCNTSFSNIGLSLNVKKYQETAKELLFNAELPSPLMYGESKFVLSTKDSDAERMMTSIGQGKTQVSPYHMALITSAIANGGKLMKPYLVDRITNYGGTTVAKTIPEEYKQLMTSKEAAKLTEYMKAVVEEGTAKALRGQSYTVAGKTGTAEYSIDKTKTHSWFVGFTNVDNPEIVISVVVEGSDASGVRAVNVAKKVLNSYY